MQRTVQPQYELPTQEAEQLYSQGIRLMSSDDD